MDYEVVDVFAEEPFSGNPLTVVRGAKHLTTEMMQSIARETNHSETTFILGKDYGAWKVRIFTPQEELPFAGHPTLGTADVLRRREGENQVVLDLPIGRVPVHEEGDQLWMVQPTPMFEKVDQELVAQAIGEFAGEAVIGRTGAPMLLVPLANSDAIRAAKLDAAAWQGPDIAGVYVYALDNDVGADIHARFFGPYVGVAEDAATGSAAGPLAAHLAPFTGTIAQGIEMGRPSRIHIRGGDKVEVGGRVIPIARGKFTL